MFKLRYALIPLICFGFAGPGWAANFADPTWPCVQRKVERLSLGLMWPTPIEGEAPPHTKDIEELAELLSLRREGLESLEDEVSAFSQTHNGDPVILGKVFEAVFQTLSSRRTKIISGIEKFSLSQIALAERIDGIRVEMNAQMARDEPDYDKVDALEEQLDWDQVIYSDRQKSIIYLCETPVLLEKRLYGVAQLLQRNLRAED